MNKQKKRAKLFRITVTNAETGEILQSVETDGIVATVHDPKDLDEGIYSMIVTNCTGEVLANLLTGIDKTKKRFEQSSVHNAAKDLLDHLKRMLEEDDE